MPHWCCVLNCGRRSNRDKVKFYRFPLVLHFKHRTDLNKLSCERQKQWLNAIKRESYTSEMKIKNARVCSNHFITGKPAALQNVNDVDWIPSVNMGYQSHSIKRKGDLKLKERVFRGNKCKQLDIAKSSLDDSSKSKLIEDLPLNQQLQQTNQQLQQTNQQLQENSHKPSLKNNLPQVGKGKHYIFLVESENTTDIPKDEMLDNERDSMNHVIEELKRKCRTCLIRKGTTDLFTSKHDGILFCDLLSSFSLAEVHQTDGLPKTICSHCANFIINAYTFKKQVEQSLITLKSAIYQLGSLKTEEPRSPITNPNVFTKRKRISKESEANLKRFNRQIERIDNNKYGSENNSTTEGTFVNEYECIIKTEDSDTPPEKLLIRTYDESDTESDVEIQSDVVDEIIKIEMYNDSDESTESETELQNKMTAEDESTESENELQSKMRTETMIETYQDKTCRKYIRNYMTSSRFKEVSNDRVKNSIDKKHILKHFDKDPLEIGDESSKAIQ
ncbi:uncharacterized protein LOC126882069 isoform X2 [Diabrotica virgifera virgifera]|uniref:ZAD domain-containing protein n=1 Tax=Diabrotica virgifera virgifera TaxID=50390 RepID=A0ABM5JY41_DIAVI|nr:uncharacterized protein LOC126882069 isoform X2 [Diabrotica virgifera virgifera]